MPIPSSSRFQRYLSVISRWLMVFGLVFVLAKLAGDYATNHFLPQYYRATLKIEITPWAPDLQEKRNPGFDQIEIGFQDDIVIIGSPDVLLPVVHDLGLETAWAKRIYKSKEDSISDQEALAYMNKILKLDFDTVPKTNMIDITVTDDDPKEAADIANAIADRYKTMRDVEMDQRNNRGLDALREQISEIQKEVDESKDAADKARQQALLDALNIRLKQDQADIQLQQSPVRIVSRAEVPTKPDHRIAPMFTIIVAGILSLLAASFVEMILLFQRAAERHGN
jgi:uncharacterized protein involved in exopolysaccharide biosynthesis